MLVTKQLTVAIDFHCIFSSILWNSVACCQLFGYYGGPVVHNTTQSKQDKIKHNKIYFLQTSAWMISVQRSEHVAVTF